MSLNPLMLVTIYATIGLLVKAYFSDNPDQQHDFHRLMTNQHFILEKAHAISYGYLALLVGLVCMFFTWVVTYFNWIKIGEFPSTPLSPRTMSRTVSSPRYQSYGSERNVNFELAYFTPILVSAATVGIILWNSM